MSKPNTDEAMRKLIAQIRAALPFHLPKDQLCSGCSRHGCAFKLLEYMDSELCDWERRLNCGDVPTFGDIQQLTKVSTKVHKALLKTGVIQ
ncbi:MAG: hypothetical protein CR974_00610 [Gammaproteobacteria bacterium]|nr:MAG: hypothetical protein CR974_00610 [Gammaproteobacteria bacterium]